MISLSNMERQVFMKKFFSGLLLVMFALAFAGCGGFGDLARDIQLSSYMQKKQHHEAIKALQGDIDRKQPVSSFRLYMLAAAYYEVRDYEKTLATADLLEKQILLGDNDYNGSDLTPFPSILRGNICLDQGEYAKALSLASDAHAIIHRTGARSNNFYRFQLIDIESIRGIAYAQLGRNAEAEKCIETLHGINLIMSNLGPEKYTAIARVRMALKQYPQALEAVQNTDAKVSAVLTVFYDQTFQELPKFFILTKCLYETGKIPEARDRYDALLKHPQIRQIGGLYWPVLLDRARIALSGGQEKEAEAFLKEAVEVIEKQRASINSEAGRIGYVGDKQAVYGELIKLLIGGNRPAEAFEYVERAKGRALVDLLASQKGIATRAPDAQAGKIYSELAKAERQIDIVSDPAGKADRERTRGVVISLKNNLRAEAPEFASLVSVTAISAREIQNRLAKDETLVEYYSPGRDWFVFVLNQDGIAVKELGAPDLDREVTEFREALTDPSSRNYLRRSQALYAKLIAPVSGLIGKGRVIVVPHGPLHYLPFGALSSGKKYMMDDATLRVLPTAAVLKFLTARAGAKNPAMLIMGNPDLGDPRYDLKFAQDEAKAIAGIMRGSTLLLRSDAKASYFVGRASSFGMVHLAAHGIFDPDNPLGSALLLAGDGSSDGRLKAGDLYSLNLKADLVTLSACETALAKITRGDDVVGFTRGFLYAGAGAIISTLWKVDDRATKDLMLAFYSRLKKMDIDKALRQAQLETRKKYPHPFYWASFQLTGKAK